MLMSPITLFLLITILIIQLNIITMVKELKKSPSIIGGQTVLIV